MQGFNFSERATRPKFAANQGDVPVGRRVNDLLAYAAEVAAANEYTFPVVLEGCDRVVAAMILGDTTEAPAVLTKIVGELIEAEQTDRVYDHNDPESEPGEKFRQSAAGIARDAVLADIEAAR